MQDYTYTDAERDADALYESISNTLSITRINFPESERERIRRAVRGAYERAYYASHKHGAAVVRRHPEEFGLTERPAAA